MDIVLLGYAYLNVYVPTKIDLQVLVPLLFIL